eukprot:s115_g27.t1
MDVHVDVNVTPGQAPERIVLFQGQNISEVAAEFSAKHVLSPAMAQKLHGLLREVVLKQELQNHMKPCPPRVLGFGDLRFAQRVLFSRIHSRQPASRARVASRINEPRSPNAVMRQVLFEEEDSQSVVVPSGDESTEAERSSSSSCRHKMAEVNEKPGKARRRRGETMEDALDAWHIAQSMGEAERCLSSASASVGKLALRGVPLMDEDAASALWACVDYSFLRQIHVGNADHFIHVGDGMKTMKTWS